MKDEMIEAMTNAWCDIFDEVPLENNLDYIRNPYVPIELQKESQPCGFCRNIKPLVMNGDASYNQDTGLYMHPDHKTPIIWYEYYMGVTPEDGIVLDYVEYCPYCGRNLKEEE